MSSQWRHKYVAPNSWKVFTLIFPYYSKLLPQPSSSLMYRKQEKGLDLEEVKSALSFSSHL